MARSSDDRLTGDLPVLSPADAAAAVSDDETLLVSGFGSVGYPKAIPKALAESGRDLSLTVVSGGSVGPEIDSDLVESGSVVRRFPYQGRREMRNAVNEGTVAFQDRNVSTVGDEVQFGGLVSPDIAIVEAVAVGDDWFVPTTSVGQTPAFVAAADNLLIEVNRAQPLALRRLHDCVTRSPPPHRGPISLDRVDGRIGDTEIPFDPESVIGVVETDIPDDPYTFREPTPTDERIAANLTGFLDAELERAAIYDEQVNMQFGVGSLGNALMTALQDIDVGDRDLAYFGEVIQDGLLEMLDAGVVSSASAASLALSEEGQHRLFKDIDRYAESVVLRPASISNNAALIDRFGVIAVNSALEVDIYGHVNSTHVGGTRVMNGVGGSGDFSRNSHLAIIALPSTAKGGEISRIVPMVPHVDHTEHDIQLVVTEQGVADLRGRSPRERAAAIVSNCAHPSYRSKLEAYIERANAQPGHIPHDMETALDWDA